MNASECVAFLRSYQAWRRFDGEPGEEGPAMPHPKSIGFAIDMAIRLIEQRGELLALLEMASLSIGAFTSDEGWSQSDMDTMDSIDAAIASVKGGTP